MIGLKRVFVLLLSLFIFNCAWAKSAWQGKETTWRGVFKFAVDGFVPRAKNIPMEIVATYEPGKKLIIKKIDLSQGKIHHNGDLGFGFKGFPSTSLQCRTGDYTCDFTETLGTMTFKINKNQDLIYTHSPVNNRWFIESLIPYDLRDKITFRGSGSRGGWCRSDIPDDCVSPFIYGQKEEAFIAGKATLQEVDIELVLGQAFMTDLGVFYLHISKDGTLEFKSRNSGLYHSTVTATLTPIN